MPPIANENTVPLQAALARLEVIPDYDCGGGEGRQPCVHTFGGGGFGCHWPLYELQALMEEHGVEEAGPLASRMGHRLLVRRPGESLLFLAARAADAEGDPDA